MSPGPHRCECSLTPFSGRVFNLKPQIEFLNYLMTLALEEADKAVAAGEVPVGAVLAEGEEVVARGHNLTESAPCAASHAEMLVIEEGSKKLNKWRLSEAILVVTLEPCTMCTGAIKLARIPTIAFGALDPRAGAMGSLYDLSTDPRTGIPPRIISGIREEECSNRLKEFFRMKR
jgi:tRNA(adenine34) deaminase